MTQAKRIGTTRICLPMICALAAQTLPAANIAWDGARNIGADADVSTEGEFVCAYNENGMNATVNGVLFRGYTSHGYLPVAANQPDILLADFGESRANTFCGSFTPTESLSAGYRNLLHGGAFNRYAGRTATVTLLGLQPGEEYLVQIWINDNRSAISPYEVLIDGICAVTNHPSGTEYGQYAIGRFRADSTEQTISIYSGVSALLNAIQVRRLPSIAWGMPRPTGDGSEVSNAGEPLYAYYFGNNGPREVNGVTFHSATYVGAMSANVLLEAGGADNLSVLFGGSGDMDRNTVYPEGTPDSYKDVLGYVTYARAASGTPPSWLDFTLLHLVPGRKYLVQLWLLDSRDISSASCPYYQKVDGVRSLYAYDSANGYSGQTITGVFIADSSSKTVRVRGYNTNISTQTGSNLNAFQVRDITDEELPETENSTAALDDATAIRTDGSLLYAYTAANENLTVNGVAFARQTSATSWGSGNVLLTGFREVNSTAFFPNASTSFEKLLAGGVYARSTQIGNQNPAPASLTFNGLEPLKPYLIQIFVNDSRSGTEDRRVKFDGQDSFMAYRNSGVVAIRPKTSSYTVNLLYTADTTNNISPQVNAVQVRRLPEPAGDGTLLWSGGASGTWTTASTGWTASGELPATPWSAENGQGRDAVVGDGTTLTVGDGVTAGNLIANGSVTLDGLPTLTGEIIGGDVTVSSSWSDSTLTKTMGGRLTLAGDRAALRQIMSNAGTLALAANQPCSPLRRCEVWAPGAIALADGAVQPVENVEGDGFVEGPGAFVIDCAGDKSVGCVWTNSAILRKTGAGTLLLNGGNTLGASVVVEQGLVCGTGKVGAVELENGTGFEVSATQSSLLEIGTLTVDGGIALNITDYAAAQADRVPVAKVGTLSGTLPQSPVSMTIDGVTARSMRLSLTGGVLYAERSPFVLVVK